MVNDLQEGGLLLGWLVGLGIANMRSKMSMFALIVDTLKLSLMRMV